MFEITDEVVWGVMEDEDVEWARNNSEPVTNEMSSVFKYDIGDEPSPGFKIVDRMVSPVSGNAMYYVNDFSTPFLEDEVESMSY
jgi:hypothetical protein